MPASWSPWSAARRASRRTRPLAELRGTSARVRRLADRFVPRGGPDSAMHGDSRQHRATIGDVAASIDRELRGPSASAPKASRPPTSPTALARTGEALDWLRARHADGSLPLLRLPATRDDLAADQRRRRAPCRRRERHRHPRHRRLEPRRPDAGATRRPRRAGRRRVAPTVRGCTSWTTSTPTPSARCWRDCRSPRRASSRSRNPAAPPRR